MSDGMWVVLGMGVMLAVLGIFIRTTGGRSRDEKERDRELMRRGALAPEKSSQREREQERDRELMRRGALAPEKSSQGERKEETREGTPEPRRSRLWSYVLLTIGGLVFFGALQGTWEFIRADASTAITVALYLSWRVSDENASLRRRVLALERRL